MRAKIHVAFITLFLCVISLVTTAPLALAYSPNPSKIPGECVWWAWERWPQENGPLPKGSDFGMTGSAYQWIWLAQHSGFPTGSVPRVGAVAVWDQWSAGAKGDGHVAYVESINADGRFLVSEYNWNIFHQKDMRWVTPQAGINFISPKGSLSPVQHNPTTIGLYDPTTGIFYLKSSNTTGKADTTFQYGNGGRWMPLKGDWDGDGTTTIGIYDPDTAIFYLRNSNSSGKADLTFLYGGNSNWIPLAGDWDGDGITTVGLYDPNTATFYLRNSNNSGKADITFLYGGNSNWIPLNGDWNGDGTTTIGLYDPAQATFYLRNSNNSGKAELTFLYGGNSNWIPTNTFTRPTLSPSIPPAQLDLPLSLEFGGARWASYADYQARELSVDYTIANVGANNAYDVTITSSTNTAGVTTTSTLPMLVGDILPNEAKDIKLTYTVPPGISYFRTTLTASAKDANRNTHTYP
ncbi:MAG: CHAP domain-containing protein [bacterium]|nr:CHAP domain-containing protein [bacterium]